MSELVILVEFGVSSDKRAEFRRLILENAALSMHNEPGCRQFDVLEPVGEPDGRFVSMKSMKTRRRSTPIPVLLTTNSSPRRRQR